MLTVFFIWFLIFVFITGSVHGEENSSAPPSNEAKPVQPPENETRGWLDRLTDPSQWDIWQSNISHDVKNTGERLDSFFGDERLDEENQKTRLRVGAGLRWHKEDGPSLLTDIKLRLSLPHLKNRFQIVVDDSVESEEPRSSNAYSKAIKDSEPDTALRYIIKQDERRRLNADAGVRFSTPSQLFGRVRGRIIVPYRVWEMRLIQTVTWFTDDGFTETSEMRFDRPVWSNWLFFRSSSRLTWEEKENGVRPAQTFSLFRELTSRRSYRLTCAGIWPETFHTREANYSVEFSYRQLIYKNWMFAEATPGLEYPQKYNFHATPYINVKLEFVFGDI